MKSRAFSRIKFLTFFLSCRFRRNLCSHFFLRCQTDALEREDVLEELRLKLESTEAELSRVVGEKASVEADLIDVKMELTSLKSLESLSKELDEYFDDSKRCGTRRGGGVGEDDDGDFALVIT